MRECTPALFNQVVDSEQTARVCAEIEDALERVKRGEMSREDFETFKAEQKKRLAIFTPHAMFPKGRRVNEDAVPSGLSMYDVDQIIRIGSAGALSDDIHVRDVVFGQAACTDSNYASQFGLPGTFAPIADFDLLRHAVEIAEEKGP